MPYFNYHAKAKSLIKKGKLTDYYFTERYKNISPALVLIFDDFSHPIMPIMIIECRNDYFRFDKPILSAFA